MTQEIMWTIIGILVTIIIALLGGIMAVRNEIAKRSQQKWERALSLAQVISAPDTPALVREVAQLALYDAGVEIRAFEDRAEKPSIRHLDTVVDAFDTPPSQEQAKRLKYAIEHSSASEETDADLRAVVAAGAFLKGKLLSLEAAFVAARNSGSTEDDARIRIVFVLVAMAAASLTLAFNAIRLAFVGFH